MSDFALTTPALPGNVGAQASWNSQTGLFSKNGVRPDWDQTWEATILAGDGDVHVDTATGNDTTATGTPSAPYATLQAAVLSIPHNRLDPSLRTVLIQIQTGQKVQLPVILEGWNSLTIIADLPAAAATGSITTVITTTTAQGIYVDTDLVYTADDQYAGFLIVYQSGKYGQVMASYNNGGFVQLYATQAVNGSAYDTLVNTNTFSLYDPDDMAEVESANTGGNGTNFNDCDGLLFRRCKITSAGGNGKLVHYNGRVTYRDCHIGPDIRRIFMQNGSLQLTNSFIEVEGEGRFGMVGGAANSVIQLRGGTCIWGDVAGAADAYPFSVSNSRLLLSGPVMLRQCRSGSLTDGATIDYADGYNAEVSWYWFEQQNDEPIIVVDEHPSGAPVSGTIPDIHGDPNLNMDYLVVANAPCQLWVGQGTDINIETGLGPPPVSTKPVSVNNGGSVLSGDAYDGTFVRSNRARSTTVFGPHTEAPTSLSGKSTNVLVDWFDGYEQTYDLSDPSNDTTSTIDWYFDNAGAGHTHVLKIIEAETVTHDWTNIPIVWAEGRPPSLGRNSGDVDLLHFYFDGTTWYGSVIQPAGLGILPDAGNGNAISPLYSGRMYFAVAATGETNTLPDPQSDGLELLLCFDTEVAGTDTRIVTASSGINDAGNTVMTFNSPGEAILLRSTEIRAGGVADFRWLVAINFGVALS